MNTKQTTEAAKINELLKALGLDGFNLQRTGKNSDIDYTVEIPLLELMGKMNAQHYWAMFSFAMSEIVARKQAKWMLHAKDGKIKFTTDLILEILESEQNSEEKKFRGIAEAVIKMVNEEEMTWEEVEAQADFHNMFIKSKTKDDAGLKLGERSLSGLIAYLKAVDSAYKTREIKRPV